MKIILTLLLILTISLSKKHFKKQFGKQSRQKFLEKNFYPSIFTEQIPDPIPTVLDKHILSTDSQEVKCLDGSTPGYYAHFEENSPYYIIVFEENISCIQEDQNIDECFNQALNKQAVASSENWPPTYEFKSGFLAEQRYQTFNKIYIKSCDGAYNYGYRVESVYKNDQEQNQQQTEEQFHFPQKLLIQMKDGEDLQQTNDGEQQVDQLQDGEKELNDGENNLSQTKDSQQDGENKQQDQLQDGENQKNDQLQDGESQQKDQQSQDGESKQQDGESKQQDGESKKQDGESKQQDGESQQKDGESQQKDGENQQKDGENQQKDGESQQKDGESQSKDGESQSKDQKQDGEGQQQDGEGQQKNQKQDGEGQQQDQKQDGENQQQQLDSQQLDGEGQQKEQKKFHINDGQFKSEQIDEEEKKKPIYFKGFTNVQAIFDEIGIDFENAEIVYLVGGTSMLLWAETIHYRMTNKDQLKLIVDDNLTYDLMLEETSENQEVQEQQQQLVQSEYNDEYFQNTEKTTHNKHSVFQKRFQSINEFAFQVYYPNDQCRSQYQENNSYLCLVGENLIHSYTHIPIFIAQSFYNFKNYILNFVPNYTQADSDNYYYNLEGETHISDEDFTARLQRAFLYFEKALNKFKQEQELGGAFAINQQSRGQFSFLFTEKYLSEEFQVETHFNLQNAIMHWLQYVYLTTQEGDDQDLKHYFVDQFDYSQFYQPNDEQ